jgi:predicted nuclease of restriction endonuclease-like (RecB) superfamily
MPSRREKIVLVEANEVGPSGYGELLEVIRARIHAAQHRTAFAINREIVVLYWQIGREILLRQEGHGWGAKVVERLGADLRREFPRMSGLSRTNLSYMRSFADAYPDAQIVEQVAAHVPWGHHTVLLDRVRGADERLWYLRQAVEHGWSRSVLVHQVESGLHRRHGRAVTNFDRTLPAADSDLAVQLLKDPYHFGFVGLGPAVEERELERALLAHVRGFLMELGLGFALVGTQYRLEVGGQDYYLDLLFYHTRLKCYVAVDLKVGAFKPEFAGKMNFYLAALDEQLRGEGDNPSIGLVLCKERNRVVAEYALRGINNPIGVAEYCLDDLPAAFRQGLPSPATLETELRRAEPDPLGEQREAS